MAGSLKYSAEQKALEIAEDYRKRRRELVSVKWDETTKPALYPSIKVAEKLTQRTNIYWAMYTWKRKEHIHPNTKPFTTKQLPKEHRDKYPPYKKQRLASVATDEDQELVFETEVALREIEALTDVLAKFIKAAEVFRARKDRVEQEFR